MKSQKFYLILLKNRLEGFVIYLTGEKNHLTQIGGTLTGLYHQLVIGELWKERKCLKEDYKTAQQLEIGKIVTRLITD